MINKALSDELLLFFEKYLSFYQDFLQLETVKYNDMAHNNVKALTGHVKNEEACLLKSRGFEVERDKLVAKTGMPQATFRELIPLFEGPAQKKMQKLYDDLSRVLLDLKETNLRNNYMTQLRLHRVDAEIKKLEAHPELHPELRGMYNSQARSDGISTGFLSKKV